MENTDFDEFVRRQQERTSPNASIDWRKERDSWIQHLNELYSRIESFLNKYISAKQILREYREIEMNEEYVGSYKVRQMTIRLGRQEVRIVPMGTMLIGAKGRVDVVGPAGRAQILLVDSKAGRATDLIRVDVAIGGKPRPKLSSRTEPKELTWEWRIVGRPPDTRFIELTQETFFQLVMEVANG